MNDLAIRRAILRRMSDGRERTQGDLGYFIKCDPEALSVVLRKMVLSGHLKSCTAGNGGRGEKTMIYRISEKEAAE